MFFEAMSGSDIALESMGDGPDTQLLAIAKSFRKVAFEFTAVVGLPDEVAEKNSVAMRMLLDA